MVFCLYFLNENEITTLWNSHSRFCIIKRCVAKDLHILNGFIWFANFVSKVSIFKKEREYFDIYECLWPILMQKCMFNGYFNFVVFYFFTRNAFISHLLVFNTLGWLKKDPFLAITWFSVCSGGTRVKLKCVNTGWFWNPILALSCSLLLFWALFYSF